MTALDMTALDPRPDRAAALGTLRQFQRDTVSHVVEQLLDEKGSKRFLVADEVGLGKTLVARGVIAEFVERHWEGVGRIDILYVCSNAALARENLGKLRIGGEGVGVIEATRFTLMPAAEERLRHKLNFISLTPATALRTSGGGIKEERAVLHQLLRQRCPAGRWLDNFLQGGVRNTERWRELVREGDRLSPEMVRRFHAALDGRPDILQRLATMETAFARIDGSAARQAAKEANQLTADLRNLLARVCIHSVQPDLIILDEFQRFKELLVTGEGEVAPEVELAQQLFSYRTPEDRRVAMLLLSATPYRMFTTRNDSGSSGLNADDHYTDFLQTLEFLVDDATRFSALKAALHRYRHELVRAASGAPHDMAAVRAQLRSLLLRVMCRRERVGSTEERDGMVHETRQAAQLSPADVKGYLAIETLREHLDGSDLIELWKSAPYLLNFGKGYEFKTSFDAKPEHAPLTAAFASQAGLHLDPAAIAEFSRLDPGNGRLRLLAEHTLDNDRWRMLWLPPSLPYWPLGGAWANNPHLTKKLIFSSWNVVPDAISALLSYELERRSLGAARTSESDDYHDVYRKRARLLRFAMSDGKAASMMTFALQIPCLPLASIHPLALRGGDCADVRALMRAPIESLFERLRPRARGNTPDPSWYWAALLLLEDREAALALLNDLSKLRSKEAFSPEGGVDEDTEHVTGFAAHVERARELFTRGTELGAFPEDLLDVLVDLALGSPSIAWARTLANFGVHDRERRLLGTQMGEAFRTLFNQPPVIGRLQQEDASRYWQATLHYAIDGNLQAVLDEYAHLLWEPAAWSNADSNAIAGQVTADAVKAITTKTSTVRPDYYRSHPERIESVPEGAALRTHFALRYGTARSSDGAHEVREDAVRDAFKSPFYPFVLASTSVGQEGLDFHPWCHSVWHWNLPGNPVDLEQREGRVHRYKGHAVRKNVAERHGRALLQQWSPGQDPWEILFETATKSRAPGESELIPCWLAPGAHKVERFVPLLPLSREEEQLERLKRNLAIYRVVFGQPRQAELLALIDGGGISQSEIDSWVVRLEPVRMADADAFETGR
jgi:hypothetical protein